MRRQCGGARGAACWSIHGWADIAVRTSVLMGIAACMHCSMFLSRLGLCAVHALAGQCGRAGGGAW